MRSPKKQFDDDDGRVIVNMDVEGMRWHNRSERRENSSPKKTPARQTYMPGLTRSEARLYTRYSLLTAGLIGLVFSGIWVLFTLFCIYVWFR